MRKVVLIELVFLVIAMLVLTGCGSIPSIPSSSQQMEQKQNENNQQKLIANQPAPNLDKSLERENIIRRLNLLNDENKVFYVYLVSYGKVMSFFTAKGKVSSVNSYLTSFSQVVKDENCAHDYHGDSGTSGCYFSMEAPDLDGTYGENGDAVYFFTTENAYVEWKGEYMVSDFPLKLSTPPELIREVK
jgi:uncharacterized protein YceK